MSAAAMSPENGSAYLLVRVRGQVFALRLAGVREICRIPGGSVQRLGDPLPPAVRGMVRLRGVSTPLLDFAALLAPGGGAEPDSGQGRAVCVRVGGQTAALLVDEVIGVRRLDPGHLSTLALPGDRTLLIGEFDAAFAQVLEAGGVIPEGLWAELQALEPAGAKS